MRPWAPRAVLLLLGAVACGGDPGAARPAVADSAGVRVLTYELRRESLPTWRTVAPHDLEIGVQDGPVELAFSFIVDAEGGPDGTVLVSDAVSREIRTFHRDGSYRGRLGGAGEGPGEFSSPATVVGVAGDTVYAFDLRASRITSFTLDGQVVGDRTVGAGTVGRPTSLLRRPDGTFIARSNWSNPQGGPPAPHDLQLLRDSVVIRRLAPDGSLLDTLGILPDARVARRIEGAGNGLISVQEGQPAYSSELFVAAGGPVVAMGHSEALRFRILRGGVRPEVIVHVVGLEHPATAEEIREQQEERLREDLGDGPIDPMLWQFNIEFLPERLPGFAELLASPSGEVWVALSELDGAAEGYTWVVFSPEGEFLGAVQAPPGVRLLAVREDHLLGVVTDEFDVPFLRRYPLLEGTP